MITQRIAIDLGSSATRIYIPRKGVVLDEPSVIAKTPDNKIAAVGTDALEMMERTPEALLATRPLSSGVVADFKMTRLMLEQFIIDSIGRFRLRKPEAMITVSSGATSTERRAVVDVAKTAGISNPFLIDAPVAAALGAGIPIADPTGNLIVHIGAGSTEIAVISLSGVVASHSIRVGGITIDNAIARYMRQNHKISIGAATAEEIKRLVASAMPRQQDETIKVQGRDTIGGMPKQIEVSSNELVDSIEGILEQIVLGIRQVMERTSPELVADIVEHGMMLTGGTAMLHKLDDLMRKVVGVPCIIAQDPLYCAVKGANIAMTNLDDYKKSFFVN
ncbi:TPA: rod shape-determining protein [Candidatus Saccharibacteria bacterium]|nr:rod shape-determining protein [Candidatus Saccharibacteria bacterium]HIO87616.1 rod shape-determining protein [Candidatus Saccharibacteria bacterium]